MGNAQAIASTGDVAWTELAARWKPIPKRPGYVLGLGVLGLAMLVMPLLYLALIAAIGYGVYWYFGHSSFHVPHAGGRAGLWALAVYLAPGVIGVVLLILLIKPVLAPRARRGEPYTLSRFEEPRLYAFVENLCHVIGAPAPTQIAVDCDINASAGFRRGLLSLVRSGDLELTLGMPLVAAMNRRQLAGILAHEFGHFAQGTGMRFTYLAHTIISWFMRAAFERDAWDQGIDRVFFDSGSMIMLILGIAVKLCVLVTRLLLILVALVGAALCSFMLRQMEFDADRYQVQLSGSARFESVFERVHELGDVFRKAVEQCRGAFQRDKHLPENFPAVIADAQRRLTREARDELMRAARSRGAGLLDSHPSLKARVAAASRLAEPGLYLDESPARGLFTDFEGACKKASFGFFKVNLGRHMLDATFVPLASSAGASAEDQDRRDAFTRFVGFETPTWRPLFPAIGSVPDVEDGKAALARLKHARSELKRLASGAAPRVEAFRKASEESVRLQHARAILDAGFTPDFKHLGVQRSDRLGLSRAADRLREQTVEAAMVIDEAGEQAMARLSAALSLLGIAGADKHLHDAARRRARADALLGATRALRDMHPWARSIREGLGRVQALGPSVRGRADVEKAKGLLRPISDEVRNRLDDARRRGGETPDPFAPPDRGTNLGESLVGASPAWREFAEIFGAGERFVDRWADCYQRAMGELCQIAESVEHDLARARQAPARVG